MTVRRNSRNKALMADLDKLVNEVQPQEQEDRNAISNKEIMVKEDVPETPDAPTILFKEKSSLVEKQFSDAIRAFDTIITKSYLSHLTAYDVVPCTNDPISNMRWVKVNEIVYEKNEFFVDKLSMLYNALHSSARNICFLLRRGYCTNNKSAVEIFIGTTDANSDDDKNVSGDILQRGLKGLFPGLSSEVSCDIIQELKASLNRDVAISCVSGVASLREDDKKERFVQGLEKLIDSTNGLKFAICFVAERVEDSECSSILSNYENLHSAISPMAETQLSFSQNETRGINETSSKTFTETVGASLSKTITKGSSHSSSHTEGSSNSYSETYGSSDTGSCIVYSSSSNYSETFSSTKSTSDTETMSTTESLSDQEAINRALAEAILQGKGSHTDKQNGFTQQITLQDRRVKHYQELLDKEIDRIQNALPYGLWSMGTYFIAEDDTTAKALAGLYKGCIVGDDSYSQVFTVNNWSKADCNTKIIARHLLACQHPRFSLPSKIEVSSGSLVSSKELAIHMSLPQTSVPGILVREEIPFGREVKTIFDLTDKNSITIGKILHLGEEYKLPVVLSLDELSKHMFVTGSTGSGKSNTMYLILSQLKQKGIKFMVIEPAKGEYKHVFGNLQDVYVYGSNPKTSQLLRINPFEFNDGIHVYEHIDRLVEIFNACWPMYAAMPVVLKKAITDAYKKCGWDLYSSTQELEPKCRLFPTVNDVVDALQNYINSSEYSADTKGDYKGSLETRLLSMSEGLTGMMLNNTMGNLSDELLFSENVIVDLSRIGNTETKSLIMGLLIMKLNEFYQTKGRMNSELNHVTVLEEAHNLLKRTSTAQVQESSNLAGKSVEMICNSIAEMRTFGEGFIIVDQSPSQVDMAAIRNTNTKIIMALPEEDDRLCAGKSIGLNDGQIDEIGRQKVGEAIVCQNDWEEPVQCKIKEFIYDKGLRYLNHKDSYESVCHHAILHDVLSFLYKYCNGNNNALDDVDKLRGEILDINIISSVKYSLLKLLDNYEKCGVDLSKRNHAKIMETVGSCIGLSEKIKKVLSSKKNIKEANVSIHDLIQELIPDEEEKFYRFCIRCSLRLLASKSSKSVEFYNNWIKTYY